MTQHAAVDAAIADIRRQALANLLDVRALRASYLASAALQAEFAPAGGFDAYAAWSRTTAANAAEIAGAVPPSQAHDGALRAGFDSAFAGQPIERRCAAEWERLPQLRAEFGNLDTYVAFRRAEVAGRVAYHGAGRR